MMSILKTIEDYRSLIFTIIISKFNLGKLQPVWRPMSVDWCIFIIPLNDQSLDKDIINITGCTNNPPALFLLYLFI